MVRLLARVIGVGIETADLLVHEVLARPKFSLPQPVLGRWLRILDSATTVVETTSRVEFPRDRSDAKFLECALSAGAEFLVTGDRDFEEAERLAGTTILSVAQFERLVLAHG
jgi:putative PIN family toxin of toxin-antitoxin system